MMTVAAIATVLTALIVHIQFLIAVVIVFIAASGVHEFRMLEPLM